MKSRTRYNYTIEKTSDIHEKKWNSIEPTSAENMYSRPGHHHYRHLPFYHHHLFLGTRFAQPVQSGNKQFSEFFDN
ncbi:unnamed protein product [Larinioides sclopetarius]|uniref:Uncharacterized protein n=1 Tax=Larinioides sclopetarius TaxID=280406 RepID=A0AAV2AIT4_9ARAC